MAKLTTTETFTTCNEACWRAREDICRCACGGRNRGILLQHGQQQPIRTRRIGKWWYKLEAVVVGYANVQKHCRDQGVWRPEAGAGLLAQRAPREKFGIWPELGGFTPSQFFQEY